MATTARTSVVQRRLHDLGRRPAGHLLLRRAEAEPGLQPEKGITAVRNPNSDPSTYDPAMFSNYLDGIEHIDSNVDDIFAKVQTGELDGSFGDTAPGHLEQEYMTEPGPAAVYPVQRRATAPGTSR